MLLGTQNMILNLDFHFVHNVSYKRPFLLKYRFLRFFIVKNKFTKGVADRKCESSCLDAVQFLQKCNDYLIKKITYLQIILNQPF